MSEMYIAPEHEFEAQHGLPELLPKDEVLIWQGSPAWQTLAIHAFHVRKIALYFVALLALRATFALADGASASDALLSTVMLLPLALMALGMLALLAWLSARTAVYTVTNKRVVMRIGVVLSVTFNLPYARIESAALKQFANGHGDIPLVLAGNDRIAFFHLWPHVRPWQVKKPQPMLRSIPDAGRVAELLAREMAKSAVSVPSTATNVSRQSTSSRQQIGTSGGMLGAT